MKSIPFSNKLGIPHLKGCKHETERTGITKLAQYISVCLDIVTKQFSFCAFSSKNIEVRGSNPLECAITIYRDVGRNQTNF